VVVKVSYTYYISRVIDMLDTAFFVLRKKNSQVTFLHVYHHASVVLGCYVVLKIQSGGGSTTALGEIMKKFPLLPPLFNFPGLAALFNSLVHVLMYGYYFLTSYKPEIRTSLWWKRYITQVQLLQFAILTYYTARAIFFTECQHSKVFAWYLLTQSLTMLVLFSKFYYKAYIKAKRT
jgi:GNS1/SUR4 family